jgi:FAD synthetase
MTEVNEDPAERARKYIGVLEKNVERLRSKEHVVSIGDVKKVEDAIRRYITDARFYLTNDKPTTSLASVTYAEGLLDALVSLQIAELIS